MKKLFYITLLLVLVACEDQYENTYRYSRTISQLKTYPVYLDMSETGKIQVKPSATIEAPFKIVSNDQYYFVGDMVRGVHVYEKKGKFDVDYLCFIECKYLKAFDIVDNFLFCNNFVDMLVLDVGNPLQTSVQHREINHFNKYTSYAEHWNIPYLEGKGCIVDYQQYIFSGVVTDQQPELDSSEYDQLYENLTTTKIPDSWTSNYPENDKPYTGIIKVGEDKIYTFGNFNNWAVCTFQGGIFRVTKKDMSTITQGEYVPPAYYIDVRPIRLLHKDEIIYVLNALNYSPTGNGRGTFDCIMPFESFLVQSHFSLYQPDYASIDVTYHASLNTFFILTPYSIRTVSLAAGYPYRNYLEYEILSGAVAITEAQDKIITLGKILSVYTPSDTDVQFTKSYSDISGSCMLKDGNVLAVANQQGLFFYDISDLQNITLIP